MTGWPDGTFAERLSHVVVELKRAGFLRWCAHIQTNRGARTVGEGEGGIGSGGKNRSGRGFKSMTDNRESKQERRAAAP